MPFAAVSVSVTGDPQGVAQQVANSRFVVDHENLGHRSVRHEASVPFTETLVVAKSVFTGNPGAAHSRFHNFARYAGSVQFERRFL